MAALGLAAAFGAGGRSLTWGCPWASSLPLFSAWQNGQGHRLQRRRLCLSVREAWFPVGLWLCSIVRLVAPGRVSGTPRSRWWAGQGPCWAGLPVLVHAVGLSAVVRTECPPGGCFVFLSSTVQEAGRKPGPRRWQSHSVVRAGELWGLRMRTCPHQRIAGRCGRVQGGQPGRLRFGPRVLPGAGTPCGHPPLPRSPARSHCTKTKHV